MAAHRPPALAYFVRHRQSPAALEQFFVRLERLAAGMMILRHTINQRLSRYAQLIKTIETGGDLASAASPLLLTCEEQARIYERLGADDLYQQPYARYVLLRLDEVLSAGGATYDHKVISIEHVLPQNPAPGSTWTERFPDPQARVRHVHRLGNLVLLPRRKNSQAGNLDFQEKKAKYFATSAGITPFALTSQVAAMSDWTVQVIEQRQSDLLGSLKNLWSLTTP